MTTVIEKIEPGFFGQIESDVIQALHDRVSVTITGVPGFGKTYFSKHILRQLAQKQPATNTFTIDATYLPKITSSDFQKAVIERLGGKRRDNIHNHIEKLTSNERLFIALDGISASTDPKLLSFFHHLGTINSSNITFITTAHASVLAEDFLSTLTGSALFGRIFVVPPLLQRSVAQQLQQYSWKTPMSLIPRIMELTGGNPALVLNLSLYVSEYPDHALTDVLHVAEYPSIKARLNDIEDVFAKYPLAVSQRIGLVDKNNRPFCELLGTHLINKAYPYLLSGNTNLTLQEEKILALLLNSRGKLVEKEKIALVLDKKASDYNIWSIYKAIERLKKRVGHLYRLTTIRGKGIILDSL